MEFTVKRIGPENRKDLLLKNQDFSQYGRMIPVYDGKTWSYRTELFPAEQVSSMCFPNENYGDCRIDKDHFFAGAYNKQGQCIGLAVFSRPYFRYLYLEDLKVCASCRRQGVGGALIQYGFRLAEEQGYRGIYAIGQDDNLAACMFYVTHGFRIGGFDNQVYQGTSQEGKGNIIFYQDLPK